ncbi:MAG: S46 family peptidase, partial [Gemmatimonadetes bacterium]|nr:S46 family peptidase [Gemmatimonadota bacterium]
ASDDYETLMHFEGLARMQAGQLAWINGVHTVRWKKGPARGENEDPDWRIYYWGTESLATIEAEHLPFVEVFNAAIVDPSDLERARTSIHEQLVTQFILDPENFEKPHELFRIASSNRHPGISVVDLDRDGFDDLYVMARWGENLFFRNRGDGTFEEIAAELGRARFEIYGTDEPPDATFPLTIADGVVTGYDYNGTRAPAFTTIYGLYDRHYSHAGDDDWALPDRWLDARETLDLSTPINFVSTADIIGGNSGSPVLDQELEVVGVVFDGNIESLPGDYIYLPELNRSVTVDVRAILEALDEVYDSDRLVLELTTGRLVETEEEADRAGR